MREPMPERVAALFERADREQAFWQEHSEEFKARYPDQWVAVRDGSVIAVNKSLRGLNGELARQGLKPTEAWVGFMGATPRVIIL